MYPIMRALECFVEASAQGARPTLLPDASEFPDGSPSADLVGSPLRCALRARASEGGLERVGQRVRICKLAVVP